MTTLTVALSALALGAALHGGGAPLTGHLRGHAESLPAAVLPCTNCHDSKAAPALSAQRLLIAVPRRGGPPSAFDRASFCTLLRTGVDAAGVVLPSAMPVYELDDDACSALWAYVTR